MIPAEKLARIVHAFKEASVDALIMGGHAVSDYGIDRDFNVLASVASLVVSGKAAHTTPTNLDYPFTCLAGSWKR